MFDFPWLTLIANNFQNPSDIYRPFGTPMKRFRSNTPTNKQKRRAVSKAQAKARRLNR
jgi:hypothetical protein